MQKLKRNNFFGTFVVIVLVTAVRESKQVTEISHAMKDQNNTKVQKEKKMPPYKSINKKEGVCLEEMWCYLKEKEQKAVRDPRQGHGLGKPQYFHIQPLYIT